MVFRVNQSPVGYDFIGTWDKDVHLEVGGTEAYVGEPSSMPIVPPFKPGDHPRAITLDVGPEARRGR